MGTAPRVAIALAPSRDGSLATVTVNADSATVHRVRISTDELARYGRGDVTDLVRRSFEFLLARESNASILPEFSLSDIERYFPEYAKAMRG